MLAWLSQRKSLASLYFVDATNVLLGISLFSPECSHLVAKERFGSSICYTNRKFGICVTTQWTLLSHYFLYTLHKMTPSNKFPQIIIIQSQNWQKESLKFLFSTISLWFLHNDIEVFVSKRIITAHCSLIVTTGQVIDSVIAIIISSVWKSWS